MSIHQEVDEEIAFHIEMQPRDLVERDIMPTPHARSCSRAFASSLGRIVLTVTAAIAVLAPAVRAMRVDPVNAFRAE